MTKFALIVMMLGGVYRQPTSVEIFNSKYECMQQLKEYKDKEAYCVPVVITNSGLND